MPAFRKAYKKLYYKQKIEVDCAIRTIVANPEIGVAKKGDLLGTYVYKFKMSKQEVLLAYEWTKNERVLLSLGTHENFYRNLKRFH